jgi:hypothetical protein
MIFSSPLREEPALTTGAACCVFLLSRLTRVPTFADIIADDREGREGVL